VCIVIERGELLPGERGTTALVMLIPQYPSCRHGFTEGEVGKHRQGLQHDTTCNKLYGFYQIRLATMVYLLTCPKLVPRSLSWSSFFLAFSSLSRNLFSVSGSSS
jgi:hypothetical protein